MFTPQSYQKDNPWGSNPDRLLWLLTPEELDKIPQDTVLHDIAGDAATVEEAREDSDTRAGYTAFGLYEDQFDTENKGE